MKNKIAVVTGASSGIGEALTKELISRGWSVIGVARSLDKLHLLKTQFGDAFIPLSCDISQKQSIHDASDLIVERDLCPSLFFLNAGLSGKAALENPNQFDIALHEKMMAVNYFGVLSWVHYWEKKAMENGGAKFIATSSVNAIFAPPMGSAYSASKTAIARAFEGLALTYFGTNLRFQVVYPGPVDTPGLSGKLPFTWKAERMAKYMVDSALKGKSHSEPSLFYSGLTRLLHLLPYRLTNALLKKL